MVHEFSTATEGGAASLIEKNLDDEILMIFQKLRFRQAGLDKPAPHHDGGHSEYTESTGFRVKPGMTLCKIRISTKTYSFILGFCLRRVFFDKLRLTFDRAPQAVHSAFRIPHSAFKRP